MITTLNIGYALAAVIDAIDAKGINDNNAKAETAINITRFAAHKWLKDGVVAAGTYFDPRASMSLEEDDDEEDEPFLEELDTSAGNHHQSDNDDEEEVPEEVIDETIDNLENVDPDAVPLAELPLMVADTQETVDKALWEPLCAHLDHIFSRLNRIGNSLNPELVEKGSILCTQFAVILKQPYFTRDGYVARWKMLHEFYTEAGI